MRSHLNSQRRDTAKRRCSCGTALAPGFNEDAAELLHLLVPGLDIHLLRNGELRSCFAALDDYLKLIEKPGIISSDAQHLAELFGFGYRCRNDRQSRCEVLAQLQ